jgi:uncharacterized protein (TIGR00369 family)
MNASEFEDRVRASFARQAFMATIGAEIHMLSSGEVTLRLPFRADLAQQHGALHAGVVSAAVDSACGYAAFSLMDPDVAVLTVEFKVNLLAPAVGEIFYATGTVIRSGKTLTVCSGTMEAVQADGTRRLVAAMQGTIMGIRSRTFVS